MLPDVTIDHRGTRGRTSTYPLTILDHARAVADLYTESRSKVLVTLALFGLGFPVREEPLRLAFDAYFRAQNAALAHIDAAMDDRPTMNKLTERLSTELQTQTPDLQPTWDASNRSKTVSKQTAHSPEEAAETVTVRDARAFAVADLSGLMSESEPEGEYLAKAFGLDQFLAESLSATKAQVTAALDFRLLTPTECAEKLRRSSLDVVEQQREVMRLALALLVVSQAQFAPLAQSRLRFGLQVSSGLLNAPAPRDDLPTAERKAREACGDSWPTHLFPLRTDDD
ncbi:MAG: hypothetical protein ABI885_24255 [Gammaproteobacteria bacterium]